MLCYVLLCSVLFCSWTGSRKREKLLTRTANLNLRLRYQQIKLDSTNNVLQRITQSAQRERRAFKLSRDALKAAVAKVKGIRTANTIDEDSL